MGDGGADDILNPPIVVLGARRYRVNVVHSDFVKKKTDSLQSAYQEEDLYADDDDESYDIQVEGSIVKTAFHVPRAFYGSIIGQKGMIKKRLESDTKTEIFIPGINATKDSLIVIKGKSRKNVCAARRRIELSVESLRKKLSITHFVCVPTSIGDIKKSFTRLRESILLESFPGIDDSLFIAVERIHITLTTCVLLDDEERATAGQIFLAFKETLTEMPPIDVSIRGLEIMNDDPSAVSVLYARISSPDLQILADKITHKFKVAQLCYEERREEVKLHMTIMNTRYRKQMDSTSLDTFDARKILNTYGDFDFGKFRITEIHLSQRHTTAANGFYVASGIIST